MATRTTTSSSSFCYLTCAAKSPLHAVWIHVLVHNKSPLPSLPIWGIHLKLVAMYFLDALDYWLQPSVSQCRRKFDGKPLHHMPCVEDVTLDDNSHPQPSWHCSGVRECSERSLINLKIFFIFSVDIISRGGMLTLAQVPSSIVLHGKTFSLYGETL